MLNLIKVIIDGLSEFDENSKKNKLINKKRDLHKKTNNITNNDHKNLDRRNNSSLENKKDLLKTRKHKKNNHLLEKQNSIINSDSIKQSKIFDVNYNNKNQDHNYNLANSNNDIVNEDLIKYFIFKEIIDKPVSLRGDLDV